jgi:hypothetical protein
MTANLLSDPTAQLSIGAGFEYCVNRAKYPSHLDPLNDESVTAQENSQPFKVCRGPVWQEIRARIIKKLDTVRKIMGSATSLADMMGY